MDCHTFVASLSGWCLQTYLLTLHSLPLEIGVLAAHLHLEHFIHRLRLGVLILTETRRLCSGDVTEYWQRRPVEDQVWDPVTHGVTLHTADWLNQSLLCVGSATRDSGPAWCEVRHGWRRVGDWCKPGADRDNHAGNWTPLPTPACYTITQLLSAFMVIRHRSLININLHTITTTLQRDPDNSCERQLLQLQQCVTQ